LRLAMTLEEFFEFVYKDVFPKTVTPVNPGSGPGEAPESIGFVTGRKNWIPAFAGMTENGHFRLFTANCRTHMFEIL
jgi:hypothetical protein